MQADFGYRDSIPPDSSLIPLVRGEFKKMHHEHAIEFIKNVQEAIEGTSKVQNTVQVKFADGTVDLSLTEATDLLHQLKASISQLKKPEITQVFKQVLNLAKLKQAVSVEVPKLPFIGHKSKVNITELLKNQKPGLYVVASAKDDYHAPKNGSVFVGFSQGKNDAYIYVLDILDDGRYKVRDKNEMYPTIEAFIENRKGQPNRLTIPLPITNAFSTAEQTAKTFESDGFRYPYFKGLTYESAFSLINSSPPGSFLICDRIKDTGGKVLIYKAASGEVRADILVLSSNELNGYECNGKWYSSFENFMMADALDENGRKFIIPYKKSAELVLAESKRSTSQVTRSEPTTTSTPIWKHDVYNDYRSGLEIGPLEREKMMQKACQAGDFAVMKWLCIQHGAPLPKADGLNPHAAAQVEYLQALLDMPPPQANDDFLHYAALKLGLGYKTANLMVQDVHAQEINKELEVAKVAVPAKLPFSDFEMRQHLAPIMGKLQDDWKSFLATFDKNDIARMQTPGFDPIATPILISPQGQMILEDMQEKMSIYFRDFPFHTPELEDWIKANPSEFYIVRSTGREDTRDNPNPGGNETIPNVKGDPYALSSAIGDVLKSYCGLKSVTQRLMVGDTGLFTEPLFLPVLVMRQVSEKVNAQGSTAASIPRSGVMLTRQEAKAEGVTLLQVGLGSCSGIVESKVPVDTYYVDSQKTHSSIIREKNSRYVPTQQTAEDKVRLSPVKTMDSALAKKSALTDPEIRDMKRVADYFSKAYGIADKQANMDMEFTLTHDEQGAPTIHLLQIRPLVEKQALNPNYLSIEKLRDIPDQNKLEVRTLLGTKAQVEDLTSSKDAMFVDNLPQALSRYLKTVSGSFQTGDTAKAATRAAPPKIIFTRQASHLTSHEAIFFRNRGVAIFIVEDQVMLDQLKGVLAKASETNPVKVCSQRGVVVDTHGCDTKDLAVNGFASYPIPLEVSIPVNPMIERTTALTGRDLQTQILTTNMRFGALQQDLETPEGFINGISIAGLLDLAATSTDQVMVKRAIATVLKIMHDQLTSCLSGDKPVGPTLRLELLHVFTTALKMVQGGLLPAVNAPINRFSSAEGHMDRLFHLKFLQGLISQPKQDEVVGSTSWNQLLKAVKREEAVQDSTKNERATVLKTLANVGVNSQIRLEWVAFINDLATLDSKYLGQAAMLVADLTRLGVTTTWMNLIFHEIAQKGESSQKVLEELLQMNQESAQSIVWAKSSLEKISGLRQQIEEWSNPDFASRNIQALRDTYTKDLEMISQGNKPQFAERFAASNKLGKLVLLETFRQAVDVYDKTIKAVTASSEYPQDNQLKCQHFTGLLVGYLRLLEGSYRFFSPEEERALISHNWDNLPLTFTSIIDSLEHGFSSDAQDTNGLIGLLKVANDPNTDFNKLLQVRPEFSAVPFLPGQHVDLMYGVEWPETAEELFTTTHQILEGIRRQLLTKTASVETLLEGRIEEISTQIENTLGQKIAYFTMDGTKLELAFQIPLRQHSCSITLQIDVARPDKGIVLKGEAFGAEEHNRWAQSATYGAFLSCIDGRYPTGSPAINYDDPRGVVFNMHLPGEGIGDPEKDDKWYESTVNLVSTLKYVFSELSMPRPGHMIDTDMIFKDMSMQIGNDWKKVDLAFFSQAPYLALTLMNKFSEKGQNELLCIAAAGALESLISYGLTDYVTSSLEAKGLPKEMKNDPRFAAIAGIQTSENNSLRVAATCYLLKIADEHPDIARPYLEKVVSNSELQNKLPETIEILERALARNPE